MATDVSQLHSATLASPGTARGEGRSRARGLTIWLPVATGILSLLVHTELPNRQPVNGAAAYTRLLEGILAFLIVWTCGSYAFRRWRDWLCLRVPVLVMGLGLVLIHEALTLKLNLLQLPYFPSSVRILDAFTGDAKMLSESVLASLRLLAVGFSIGVLLGLPMGTIMGWYPSFRYWMNPLIRTIGPIPSSALIPLAMVVFPTSHQASVFLLVLAAWFPVTVMTWSGVANVSKSYFDIGRTLGASERYLVLKIALPAAMPTIFVGLFMGMGATFATLILAEMLGVKAGLGFYIQWAQAWGEYYKVYAGLVISGVLFSTLISVLFLVRDRVLVWQKGLVRW
jgi:NitT/TauT family transport system permease protein